MTTPSAPSEVASQHLFDAQPPLLFQEGHYGCLLFLTFECGDTSVVLEDVADLVEIFEDARLRKRIDRKFNCRPTLDGECLGVDVDRDVRSRLQQCVRLAIHHDRKQSVLQAF